MSHEPVRLDRLATEARNPRSERLDMLSSAELVALMVSEDRLCAEAVAAAAGDAAGALDAIVRRMRLGGRLIYCGAGTSGRLGLLDAVECPPTFSSEPGRVVGLMAGGERAFVAAVEGAEDDAAAGAADLRAITVTDRDAVVLVSASGRTPYVLGALREARARGAATVAVVCSADGPLAAEAEHAVTLLVGPEVLTGSTRLKAGTATKMVLNMLSTGAFVALGKAYSNLMVDVQPTNAKLRARAARIVAQATGLPEGQASSLLERCGGETKTAIVVALRGVEPDTARSLISVSAGSVRAALAAPGT